MVQPDFNSKYWKNPFVSALLFQWENHASVVELSNVVLEAEPCQVSAAVLVIPNSTISRHKIVILLLSMSTSRYPFWIQEGCEMETLECYEKVAFFKGDFNDANNSHRIPP